MESAVLIHPALEFLLTVLPLVPDCPTTDQKPAPRLPQTKGMGGADFWGKSWGSLGQSFGAILDSLQIN